MGSSNQNETRKEHRLRDMPPLGPMQKKSRVSEQIVAWGYFSPDFASVLVPGRPLRLDPSYFDPFVAILKNSIS